MRFVLCILLATLLSPGPTFAAGRTLSSIESPYCRPEGRLSGRGRFGYDDRSPNVPEWMCQSRLQESAVRSCLQTRTMPHGGRAAVLRSEVEKLPSICRAELVHLAIKDRNAAGLAGEGQPVVVYQHGIRGTGRPAANPRHRWRVGKRERTRERDTTL